MIKPSIVVLLTVLAGAPLRAASSPAAAVVPSGVAQAASITGGDMMSLSLIDALTAVDKPELAGIFTYVSERDAPHALAGLLARDVKSLKRWLKKVDEDFKTAGGTTAWDHEVCAMLVNIYAGSMGPVMNRPPVKLMRSVNNCVLAPVVTLQDIAGRRKR